MSTDVYVIGMHDWEMLFVGDECVYENHSIDADIVARRLEGVNVGDVHTGHVSLGDLGAETVGMMPTVVKERGPKEVLDL